MNIFVNPQISLLVETADLVFAYANQMGPAALTMDKPYCIPVHEVGEIMEAVCGDLDPMERRLKFFFQGYTIESFKNTKVSETCVGNMLIHTGLLKGNCDLQTSRKVMHDHLIGSGAFYKINSFNPFGIGVDICDEHRFIAEELSAFDMPDGLRLQLLEVLSNYHYYVDMLCDLLEPLALRLLPLLEPWWEKAAPRLEQWSSSLHTEKGREDFFSGINMDTSKMKALQFSLHIFRPGLNRININLSDKVLYSSMGLEILPVKEEGENLSSVELAALRLLSGADRLEMLRAMSDRIMTPKELTEDLGLNSGSVFRDLGNLFQAHLVEMVVDGLHRSYKTNVPYLDALLRRLGSYIKKQNG